jgi:hypothetical protein
MLASAVISDPKPFTSYIYGTKNTKMSKVPPPCTATAGNGSADAAAAGDGKKKYGLKTRLVHSEAFSDDPFAASMPPIYQTATFGQPGAVEMGEYDYNRSGNPTRTVLERQMADLEVRTAGSLLCIM